jgi:hypothetical protein
VIESIPAIIQAESDAGAAPDGSVMNMRTRQRPAVGGLSAGHFQITAGTIACFCRSTKAGDDPATKYVLSNNHVFANVNRAKIGDDIYQPGPIDGGDTNAVIAKLHRFVALQMGGEQANRIDAAIAELCAGIEFENAIHRIGAITGTTEAKLDLQVRKQGRTSGYTEGKIDDIEYDAIVGMDHQDPTAKAVFHGQMRIVASPSYPAIGLGGDSGSLVVEHASQNAVGLYFAGPPGGNYGIANPIKDVLKELEITLG